MQNLNEYLNPINESYYWDGPSKKDMKDNIDKLIAISDALGYLEYYEGRHSNDVLDWLGEEIIGASKDEIESIKFYNDFDVEDEVYEFIDENDLDEDSGFSIDEIMDRFKSFLNEYKDIDEAVVEKILAKYEDDIQKEFFDRGIVDEI